MFGEFELFREADGFGFRLRAGDGAVVLAGSGYACRESALEAIEAVRERAVYKAAYEGHVRGREGCYFVLKSTDGHVLAASPAFETASAMNEAVWSSVWSGTTVRVRELSGESAAA